MTDFCTIKPGTGCESEADSIHCVQKKGKLHQKMCKFIFSGEDDFFRFNEREDPNDNCELGHLVANVM